MFIPCGRISGGAKSPRRPPRGGFSVSHPTPDQVVTRSRALHWAPKSACESPRDFARQYGRDLSAPTREGFPWCVKVRMERSRAISRASIGRIYNQWTRSYFLRPLPRHHMHATCNYNSRVDDVTLQSLATLSRKHISHMTRQDGAPIIQTSTQHSRLPNDEEHDSLATPSGE